MFPLGTALLPGEPLALQVFEPRYVALVRGILANELAPEFGVVLISRGSEVGGADERTDVGTLARVVEIGELPGGRFALRCVGGDRIRVERWLPDEPFPRADITAWPDEPDGPIDEAPVRERLVELYAVAAELAERDGRPFPPLDPLADLPDGPTERSYVLLLRSGLGQTDRHAALAAPGPSRRLALLATALDDRIAALRFALL